MNQVQSYMRTGSNFGMKTMENAIADLQRMGKIDANVSFSTLFPLEGEERLSLTSPKREYADLNTERR
jgi:Tfp pilus assembly pilus retraction ATPase PilT